MCNNSYTEIIEDTIDGFDIYIEPNSDHYNEGYVWSVSKDSKELETGLSFSLNNTWNEYLVKTLSKLLTNPKYYHYWKTSIAVNYLVSWQHC